MNFVCNLLLCTFMLSLFSCGKDDKRLEEVSGIQGQQAAEKQIEEENRNLAAKAQAMELELKKRTEFYQALVGDYQGEVTILGQKSMIELSIQSHNMPAPYDRVRKLEEISYDLNQISLSVLFKHYTPKADVVAVTCEMIGVKPDIKKGLLSLASEDCPNFYLLSVSKNPEPQRDPEQEVTTYSQEIYSASDQVIPYLKGYLNPGSTPGKFELYLKRTTEITEGK